MLIKDEARLAEIGFLKGRFSLHCSHSITPDCPGARKGGGLGDAETEGKALRGR